MFCGTCPAYQSPPRGADGAGGPALTRGECHYQPQTLAKLPHEWCMQHPARLAAMMPQEPPEPEQEKLL